MAEKIINNPSLLPGDLDIELSGNAITAISGHPLIGTGGGTQSDYVYYPDFDETTGNIEFKLGTIDNPPSPIGGWHISGADGARGPQGDPGNNGKTPTFQIDPKNAHWEWKYTDDEYWTDTHVVASGAVGPKGDKGDNGISPTVSTSVIDGGNRVTFTYGAGSSTYIDVMSGAPGAPGAEGFSPTISTTPITDDPDHPQGGTKVTVTDSTGTEEFKIWNGVNGQGATVNLKDGDGIHITQSSNDYTIGVSANYSAMAVTWVQTQNYLTSVPDNYATKTYANEASANALSEAESWVNLQNFATKSDISDMATQTWVGQQGYLKAVPDSYATKTYANEASANALSEAESWVGQRGFITKDVNNLTYYYNKTETSSTSEITDALSTKLDSTVAEQTYQTKAGMTNYLTTSDASTTYATKTYANETSANALDQAESWVESEGYIKSVPDITANNGLSATGHTVGISTTNIDANKQYAWTTNGWEEVNDYLPTSGGTVSGQLVVSGGSTFDQQFLKITRENVNGYARLGLGQYGALALKTDDSNSHTTQVNISPNASNDQLVQVQHNSDTVGYLIPAKIHQGSYTPSENDGVLHIVLES